ncbi:CopD family protein [Pseudonocardia endophytica]|uniref:Putative copper resistance protein D n=1 Tax=Pseudonocardia endophytica TaxID=401976 RepID=A0A4V2PJ08_PSEEN|nr:CopD family protein [Pseudonocardia endophytica]TCK26676.1 putative copper resistance protein D [Pseudonocardia endophytica]
MTEGAVGASATPEAADRPAGRAAPLGWAAVALGSAVLAAGATGGLTGGMPAVLAATLTRGAMDVAGVACVGAVLLALLAPGHAAAAAPVLRGAATVWLGAGLLDLVFRTALVLGKPVTEVQPPDLVAFVTGPSAGTGLVAGVTAAALVLGCSIAGPLGEWQGPGPAWLTLVLALAGLAGPAATGHATGSGEVPAIVAVVLHAPAAALWVGGLAAMLVVAGQRDVLVSALPRFSRLAVVCITVLAVTGVVAATARIDAVSELASPYGALLFAKAGCLLAAGVLGGLTRRRLHTGRTPVLTWAGVEVLVLAVAVGLAGTLSQTA